MTPRDLKVGEILEVRLDEDGAWLDEWAKCKIYAIRVCHHYRKDGSLEPYVHVEFEDDAPLIAINYSMYCWQNAVRRPSDQQA